MSEQLAVAITAILLTLAGLAYVVTTWRRLRPQEKPAFAFGVVMILIVALGMLGAVLGRQP